MPTCWAAKEITVVVPPNAAEAVALSNVSAFMMPAAERCSIWLWLSTPPGRTTLPRASISRFPGANMRVPYDRRRSYPRDARKRPAGTHQAGPFLDQDLHDLR